MNDEVQVLPYIVIVLCVEFEALVGVSFKNLPVNIANEAKVVHVLLSLTFLISQLSECIDDDTEDDVEEDSDDDQEECQVICRSEGPTLLILFDSCLGRQELSDTSTTSQPIVDGGEEAVHHRLADRVSFSVQQSSMDLIIVECVVQENERNGRVDVNDDDSQHGRHEQLIAIQCHTLDHILELREPILKQIARITKNSRE